MKSNQKILLAAAALWAAAATAQPAAPVKVEGAWARASVQGQSGTGAFMTLTASEPLTLVGVSSPAAAVAELHEMKHDGDVMRMRAIESLPLPAGQPVQLKPGGHHLMLQQLRAPLKPDTQVPVRLTFRTARGETRNLDVAVPVGLAAPGPMGAHKH